MKIWTFFTPRGSSTTWTEEDQRIFWRSFERERCGGLNQSKTTHSVHDDHGRTRGLAIMNGYNDHDEQRYIESQGDGTWDAELEDAEWEALAKMELAATRQQRLIDACEAGLIKGFW